MESTFACIVIPLARMAYAAPEGAGTHAFSHKIVNATFPPRRLCFPRNQHGARMADDPVSRGHRNREPGCGTFASARRRRILAGFRRLAC
ncbi:hypothetical protein RADP37_05544 [Roseomonas mucosa]|uniref:Uncharacterized protein n=1 Tax=Roseomonas mucosa TaxID=207340 RepID=A0A4Y1MTA2_9PROT|nr:hypothetical protein RADP37_05544 [Roseomonas mucosa]UZO90237.1 Gluconolactonase [Roseomonas mucosa]